MTSQAKGGKPTIKPGLIKKLQCNDKKDNDGDGYCDLTGCYIGRGKNKQWYNADSDCDNETDNKEGTDCVPSQEICDGIDNDCNTIIDDGFDQDDCLEKCTFNWVGNGGSLNCCGDDAGENSPFEVVEITLDDGNDNDCDGEVDEGGSIPTDSADSVLHLGDDGYAYLDDADVTDLDYSRDFSVEVITKIEPHSIGGRWGPFIQKGHRFVLFNSGYPGFGIGTNAGHLESFGQKIRAKVGDGTNHITLSSQILEGYVYAIMTWDSTTKELILYINGNEYESNINLAINPLNIVNTYELHVGKGNYKTLNRDIFMMRAWNRELSSIEVTDLWDNYDINGQHILPSGFDSTELHSEWLMGETSDVNGGSGTTHIKDTAGNNHLLLTSGAEIYKGEGVLTMLYPSDGAVNVDKSVILKAGGGISTLGSVVKPLQYYFQIDEVNTFNSANLKESGWIKHYGQYKPVLKPNTLYYWRVKVRDSDSAPIESSYALIRSFTTEGPTNWYVRPGVYSGVTDAIPVPISGTYGSEDGTSYDNAWNGIREIKWGENGVEAGDNLYVCGEHVYKTASQDYFPHQAKEYIKESGFSDDYPITIRMDCVEEPGILYGFWDDNRQTVVWNGPDANGVYWTNNLQYGAAVEYNGSDYVWLDVENETTWVGHYGARYKDGGTTYVKTTDGSNPTGKMYTSTLSAYGYPFGFSFNLGRSKYIKFYKGDFYSSIVGKERRGDTDTDMPVSTNIVFDSNKMRYGVTYWLFGGHDYWTFKNNDIRYAGNGIYAVQPDDGLDTEGLGASYSLIENNTFKDLGLPEQGFYHQDAHAFGVMYGGSGHVVQGNYIENTGAAILFHAYMNPMKDNIIRNNFIKNIRANGASGSGIGVSGLNTESLGRRTGFKIYNNIIINTGIGKTQPWHGNGIGTNNKDFVEIYNNVIINAASDGISFGVMNGYPPQGKVYNNIIVNPGDYYLQIIGASGDWSNFATDYNLYYDTTDFDTDFYFSQVITRDENSILADPMFVSGSLENAEDFKLQSGSPAIDAGINVGLTQDYEGNSIPQGAGPDIGAYEYTVT